ncbi:MAG: hypothetical protein WC847_02170 [Candidatus Paceibacterota bacterium]|jgi:hypothetical protein
MKYKKQIATGALAISLLVSGSSVFAAGPQDLGIKNVQPIHQKEGKGEKGLRIRRTGKANIVGTIGVLSSTGFTIDVKNLKTKQISSVDVKTDASTTYKKDGISATLSNLAVGQKVIVVGTLDKTTNILTAKTVKIVTKAVAMQRNRKGTN